MKNCSTVPKKVSIHTWTKTDSKVQKQQLFLKKQQANHFVFFATSNDMFNYITSRACLHDKSL